MIHVKSPERAPIADSAITIFLAGSIEMDTAEKWQDRTVESLKDLELIHILNPRRDSWNSEWKQTPSDPSFNEQVRWEMSYLDRADIKSFYFDPNTKSPVTLLELGLCLKHFAQSEIQDKAISKDQRLVICCPDGFWRKGNVQIALDEYRGLRVQETFEEFIASIRSAYDDLLTTRAYEFAKKAHTGQVRKFSGIPYITHPCEIANQAKYNRLPSWIVAAAYLHDVVEDCEVTLEQLTKVFGPSISKLVCELTNPSKGSKANRAERKKMDREHIAGASKEAKIVKLLDRTHNISDMQYGDPEFAVKYCKESRDLLAVIKDASPELAAKLEAGIAHTERVCLDKIAAK